MGEAVSAEKHALQISPQALLVPPTGSGGKPQARPGGIPASDIFLGGTAPRSTHYKAAPKPCKSHQPVVAANPRPGPGGSWRPIFSQAVRRRKILKINPRIPGTFFTPIRMSSLHRCSGVSRCTERHGSATCSAALPLTGVAQPGHAASWHSFSREGGPQCGTCCW